MTSTHVSKLPHECVDISEVRNEIDHIDRSILHLLSSRFGYVREVVKYKEQTDTGIEASDRRKAVIATRREWAQAEGISPDVVEAIYNHLIDYFIEEEKKIMNN